MFDIFDSRDKKKEFVKDSFEGVTDFANSDWKTEYLNSAIDKERFKFVLGIYCINYMNCLLFILKSIEEVKNIFPIILEEFNKLFLSDRFIIGDFIKDDYEKNLCCKEFDASTFDEIKNVQTNMTGLLNAVFKHREEEIWPLFSKILGDSKNNAEYYLIKSLARQYSGANTGGFLIFQITSTTIRSVVNLSYEDNKW